jgi:hypothetical protein
MECVLPQPAGASRRMLPAGAVGRVPLKVYLLGELYLVRGAEPKVFLGGSGALRGSTGLARDW